MHPQLQNPGLIAGYQAGDLPESRASLAMAQSLTGLWDASVVVNVFRFAWSSLARDRALRVRSGDR